MSIKIIKESIDEGKVLFGVKQAMKHKKDIKAVYLVKDARNETILKLKKDGIEFTSLKPKEEMTKNLNLDFSCEVFSIKK